jgi:hypothetical protein
MSRIGNFLSSFIPSSIKPSQVQQSTPVPTQTNTNTNTAAANPFGTSTFQNQSKPLVAGVGMDAMSFTPPVVANSDNSVDGNGTVEGTSNNTASRSGRADLPNIPITDPRWAGPPLSAAVTGQPPNQQLDLDRVTPQMLEMMTPEQLTEFFGMIDGSGQSATVYYQNGPEGMPFPEPSQDVSSALMMQLWNQSQDPEMLLKAMQAGFSPESSTWAPYMTNLFSAGTVEALNTAMRNDGALSPEDAGMLTNFIGNAMASGADAAGMATTVDGLVETMKQDPAAYAGQANSLVSVMTSFPSLASADRIAGMFTTLKAGGILEGPEADALGTLVQSYFSSQLGENPTAEQAQQAMTELLNAMGAEAPSPDSQEYGQTMGYAAGIVAAGLIKHFEAVNGSIEQSRELASTLLGVAGSGTALINPAGGQVLAAAVQTLLGAVINNTGNLNDQGLISQWQGGLMLEWQQRGMNQEAAQDATNGLVAVLMANGVDL